MTHYCSFHPLLPAHWQCEHCKSDVCQNCMPDQGLSQHALRCPSCNAKLVKRTQALSTPPIWQQYAAILIQPFVKHSGVFLLAIFVVFAISAVLQLPIYIAWLGACALAVVYGGQLSSFLAQSTDQRVRPPALTKLFQLHSYRAAFPTLLVWAAAVLAYFLLDKPEQMFSLCAVFFILCLVYPALALMQVKSDEYDGLSALNHFVLVMTRIGNNYISLCCWGLILLLSGAALVDGLQRFTPTIISTSIAPVLLAYLVLVWHSVVGFSMHSPLSGGASLASARRASLSASIEDRRIGIALREGKYEQVVALLEGDYYRNGMPDYRLEQLYKLSLALSHDDLLLKYGAVFTQMLLRRGRDEEALTLLQTLRRKNPAYRVTDAPLCLALVQSCEREKKYKLLLWLVQDIHWRFPKAQGMVAEMYSAAAKVLHKHFKQDAKALAYMKKAVQARDIHENEVSK